MPRNGGLPEKLQFLTERVPIGFMDQHHIGFCHQVLFDFSAKKFTNQGLMAEAILERLELEASIRGSEGILSPAEYARAIRTLARTDEQVYEKQQKLHQPPFRRAKAILDRMIDRHSRKPDEHPAPTIHVYDAVLFVFSKTEKYVQEALDEGLDLLRSVERDVLENKNMTLTATTYNNIFHLYSKNTAKIYGAAAAAEDLLMHFSKLSADGLLGTEDELSKPNSFSFNCVLRAWAYTAEDRGADRALEILQFMCGMGNEHTRVQPDAVSFGSVITAFARRQRPEEATSVYYQAIKFFDQQHREQKSLKVENGEKEKSKKKNKLVDLTGCFGAVMSAWAEVGDPDTAEALFRDAQNLSIQQDHGKDLGFRLVPDEKAYRAVVNAYVASGRKGAIDKAHQFLKNMILAFQKGKGPPPDREIFHSVIWELSGPEAAMHADELLHSMVSLSRDHGVDCSPATTTFIMCIRYWSKQHYNFTAEKHIIELYKLAESQRVLSRSICQFVVNYLAEHLVTVVQAALILENLPLFVKLELKSDHHSGMALFTKTLRTLAKVKSAVAAEHSMRLLRLMQDLEFPITSMTYTKVLNAFSSEKTESAAHTVCLLLKELKQADADPNSEIRFTDPHAFSSVLEVLKSVGTKDSAEKACDVLNDMFQIYSAGRPEVEPTEECLDACLSALCGTKDTDGTRRAVQLLVALSSKTKVNGDTFLPPRKGIKNVLDSCLRDGLEEEARQVREFFGKMSREGPLDKNRAPRVNSLLRKGELDKADQLLREMIIAFEEGRENPPNSEIFHSVIVAWCNNLDKPQAGIKAEELLRSMIRLHRDFCAPTAPSVWTFAACITFWTKQPHNPTSVDHVSRLFSLAEEYHAIRHYDYQNIIEFLAKPSSAMQAAVIMERFPSHIESGLVELDKKRTPPLFSKTIIALSKIKSQVSSDQALKLFRVMQDIGLKHDVFTYTSVLVSLIYAYFGSDHAVEVACSLYDELKQADADRENGFARFDSSVFEIVLTILSQNKKKSSANKACEVLNDMFQLYASGRPLLEPTATCIGKCLNALCATGDEAYIRRAVQLFFTLGSKINSKGFQYLPPEEGVKVLARSCSKAGLELEADQVLNFWKNTENTKVA